MPLQSREIHGKRETHGEESEQPSRDRYGTEGDHPEQGARNERYERQESMAKARRMSSIDILPCSIHGEGGAAGESGQRRARC